jgi:hypothetical protein
MSTLLAGGFTRVLFGLTLSAIGISAAVPPAATAQDPALLSCTVSFVVAEVRPQAIGAFRYRVEYDPQKLNFVGRGSTVACRGKVMDVEQDPVASEFSDDDAGTLDAGFSSAVGVATFTPLAVCDLHALGEPTTGDFTTTVVEAAMPDGTAIAVPPPVLVSEVSCSGPATTTTTSTTTTTTTPMAPGCADPALPHGSPNASDCLFILRASVGSASCDPACVCSPSGSSVATATDALLCLKAATGQDVDLACPCS